MVQDAFADEATWRSCPDRDDAELLRWFRAVLANDALDLIRSLDGRRRITVTGEEQRPTRPRLVSYSALEDAADSREDNADLFVLAVEDPQLEALELADEREHIAHVLGAALEVADARTARLLRARLEDELPAAIALREGWSKAQYERRVTTAYKQLTRLIARIESGPHCSEIRTLLRARSGPLLSNDARHAIDTHIASCLTCKAFERTLPQRLRERIGALLPWPVPGFLIKFLSRGGATDAAIGGGGGGATAVSMFASGGAKMAALACAGLALGGGCIGTVAAVTHHSRPHHHPRAATATAALPAGAANTTASLASPITTSTRLAEPTHAAPSPSSAAAARLRSQRAAARRRAAVRHARQLAARRRAAAVRSGGEGEFGPQSTTAPAPTAAAPQAAPAVTPTPAPAPRTSQPAPAKTPAPTTSSFHDEFTPAG